MNEVDDIRIRFVGGWRLSPPPGDYALMSLWDRLPAVVRISKAMSRFVRYESPSHHRPGLEFCGMEVDEIQTFPPDLVGWELTSRAWCIWESGPSGPSAIWREAIQWLWLEPSAFDGRPMGEFIARGPANWFGPDAQPQPFLLAASAPVVPGKAAADDVHLVDYDPAWPQQFAQFAVWLATALGGISQRVEHFGSTAIPGMPAKPIIDILVEIPSFEEAKRRVLPLLAGPQWEYWWYADKITLICRSGLLGQRTHHIHLAPRGHGIWRGLAFRDYLRMHPAEATAYATLKRQLATVHRADREAYTRAKSVFVRRIEALAADR